LQYAGNDGIEESVRDKAIAWSTMSMSSKKHAFVNILIITTYANTDQHHKYSKALNPEY